MSDRRFLITVSLAVWVPFYLVAWLLTGNWFYMALSCPLAAIGTVAIFWPRVHA